MAIATGQITISDLYDGVPGETGPQGPSGNPGAIGVNTDGPTILVSGFDADGVFGAPTGIIHTGTSRYRLEATSYTVAASGQGYILACASGAVRFATLVAGTAGATSNLVWKDFNTGVETTSDAVIGCFTVESGVLSKAEIFPALSPERFIRSHFMEILRDSDATGGQLQDLAAALGADRILQTVVAMEAFIRSLWVSRLQSELFATDAYGYPSTGFCLDGISGIAKIASLMAKNADIAGRFNSDGFRTIDKVAGTVIPVATIPPTIYRYSEMCDLIASTDGRGAVSGTIEGFAFTRATRRLGQRVLLHANGSASDTITAAGGDKDPTILSRVSPLRLFGDSFFVQWNLGYSASFANRKLWRTKPGQTADQVFSDLEYQVNVGTEEAPEYVHPERTAGELWSSGSGSGDYAGSYGIDTARPDITVWVFSGALWGSATASSSYLRVWTNQAFTGLVLTNADAAYSVVAFQPDAFYPSASKAFSVGAVNQDSASMKKYRSGTALYDLFAAIPVGTNSAATGTVLIDGVSYAVTRLRKDEDRIVFFTGTQEVHVRKFISGTSIGAHTDLAITAQIVLGAMDGGIESMWVVPWAHAVYDIGQTAKRFRSMYLSGEMVSGSIQTGSVSASSVSAPTVNALGTTNKVYGAVFN